MNDTIAGFSRDTFALLLTASLIVATVMLFGATVGACKMPDFSISALGSDQ